MPPIITLTTDFGTRDTYVGAMKGVVLSICPNAVLVDLTHEIPPQDVRAAAYALAETAPLFPRGTVHLAVVDPGVGSDRRCVAFETAIGFFVGPDNGLFAPCLRVSPPSRAVSLENPAARRANVSATFHGRDVFAPAAAHIANGADMTGFGPILHDWVALELPKPRVEPGHVQGEVIHVDRFGNLVTNLTEEHLPAHLRAVEFGFSEVHALSRTFSDVEHGGLLALIGSTGSVEICVRDGSAAERFGLGRGAKVVVRGDAPGR
jgi:hypothetical protein